MLEIVEREALELSGCLALGESFYAAMSGSIFFKDGGLALVESWPHEGQKQLNCLNGFELRGCCDGRGNLFTHCLTRSTTHLQFLTSACSLDQKLNQSRSPSDSSFRAKFPGGVQRVGPPRLHPLQVSAREQVRPCA